MSEYIEREALLTYAIPVRGEYDDSAVFEAVPVPYVKGVSAADVHEVRHGWWERIEKENVWGSMTSVLKCSVCQKWKTKNRGIEVQFSYCPNCGARMDKEK